MTQSVAFWRRAGWLSASTAAFGILSGATALALSASGRDDPAPMFLNLLQMQAAAPTVAAVSEAAPTVVDEAPDQDSTPAPPDSALQSMPKAEDAAPVPRTAAELTLPLPDNPIIADMAVPPAPEAPVAEPIMEKSIRPVSRPEPKEAAKKPKVPVDTPKKKTATANPAKKPTQPASAAAGAAAPKAGPKASGGAKTTPAAYAKAVMKKVRGTKKQKGAGKGVAIVGFSIAKDGSLSAVKVLKSSGNSALDKIALAHIQRSAPFPKPPERAGRGYSFEFVGR